MKAESGKQRAGRQPAPTSKTAPARDSELSAFRFPLHARFRFTPREFVGSLADLGTLLPLLVGLIAFNGVSAGPALALIGLTYISTGILFRVPVPVQPLKAAAMIAIATGASLGQVRAAALWMALIMLFLATTKLADKLNGIFPKVLIHGIQAGLGLMMVRSGVRFIFGYPSTLGSMVHGTPATIHGGILPSGPDFASALFLLVLPQIPLTIGNSVVATRDCAMKYFGSAGDRVTANRLSATIGLGNLAAGLIGGMPMCHGAGGMTAHYHFGARTGAAGVMIGAIFLVVGMVGGHRAAALLPLIPAWVLGVPLVYAGVRHVLLARDSFGAVADALVVISMGIVSWYQFNLLFALAVGLGLMALLRYWPFAPRRRLAG